MEHGFSYLMFCFSGGLLIYAGLIAKEGYKVIPKGWAADTKDKKSYAKNFAKLTALCALAPLFSGIAGLFVNGSGSLFTSFFVLIISFILLLVIGIKRMNKND